MRVAFSTRARVRRVTEAAWACDLIPNRDKGEKFAFSSSPIDMGPASAKSEFSLELFMAARRRIPKNRYVSMKKRKKNEKMANSYRKHEVLFEWQEWRCACFFWPQI